ncbi:hypothetical protein D3C75_1347830 [compost metagenome]
MSECGFDAVRLFDNNILEFPGGRVEKIAHGQLRQLRSQPAAHLRNNSEGCLVGKGCRYAMKQNSQAPES